MSIKTKEYRMEGERDAERQRRKRKEQKRSLIEELRF